MSSRDKSHGAVPATGRQWRFRVNGATRIVAGGALVLAAFAVHAAPASAESPASPGAQSSTLAALGVKGQAILNGFGYFRETPTDDELLVAEGILQLEWSRRLAEWADMKVVLEAREDTDSLVGGIGFEVPDRRRQRSVLELREGTVTARRGPVDVILGKQIVTWGTADAYNPTDNVNPYDFLDVIDNEKLAVFAAVARFTAGASSLTGVLVPVFTPSRLPLKGSRWIPTVPEGLTALVADRELPAQTLENMQYAARLKTTVGGWDLSGSYFEGFEHTPVFRLSAVQVAPGTVLPQFTPVFTRIRAVSMDVSTTYRRLEIHGESTFKFVERNGREDRLQTIVGLNYTLDGLDLAWLERIFLVAEYGREVVLASHPESRIVARGDAPGIGDLLATNAFRNAVAGRVNFVFNEETQLKLTGTADLTRSFNYYAQVKLSRKLGDAVQIDAGFDVLHGAPKTFWGRWRDNDRFFFRLAYFF